MSYEDPSIPDILEGIELGEEFDAQRLASHCYERMSISIAFPPRSPPTKPSSTASRW
jgi:hypothetical protein